MICFSEEVRKEAMRKAMETGEIALSAKIKLLQDYDKDTQSGF